MSQSGEKSFLQQLWEKGFVRNLASYLLGAWAILQFVDWIVTRYHLSSNWTDAILVFFLAMLPSVLLYTYWHSKEQSSTIKRMEKIIIPSNIVVALGAIFIFFSGQSFGATASAVTVVDEEGEQIERLVPNANFLKRFLFLPTQLEGVDDNSLRFSIPNLQCYDLEQDNRIYAFAPTDFRNQILRSGFTMYQDMPVSIQKEIAEEYYTDYFVQSNLKKTENTLELSYKVFNTNDGKAFFEKSYAGSDLFNLIDQFSEDLEDAVYLMESSDGTTTMVDLPSDNLISSDWEVIQKFQTGYIKHYFDNKPDESIKLYEQAIQKDPNCALCYQQLAFAHFSLSDKDALKEGLENALARSKVLPERMQLEIKYFYYYYTEKSEKAKALLEMWRQLYPNDYIPYVRLMTLYSNKLQNDKAIEIGQQAIEAGHAGFILTRMANLYSYQGNTEKAIEYFQLFSERYPNRVNETSQLGYIYRKQGDLEKAKQHFEKIHLLDPQNYLYIGSIGQIEGDMGNFDQEIDYYKEALRKAKLTRDSTQVMQWMEHAYIRKGKIKASFDLMEERFDLEASYLTPYQVYGELITPSLFYNHSTIDNVNAHYQVCKEFLNTYNPNDESRRCFLELVNALFDKDLDMSKAYQECKETYEKNASENEKALARAFLAKKTGKYKEAIELFTEIVKAAPDTFFKRTLAESYFALENYDEALKLYQSTLLDYPQYPEVFAEIAYVYQAKGDQARAKEYLEKALAIWEEADAEYIPAQKAKAALQAL